MILACHIMNSFQRNGKPAESRGRKAIGPENGSQLPKGSFLRLRQNSTNIDIRLVCNAFSYGLQSNGM